MDSFGNKRGESDWLKIVRGGRDQGFFKASHRRLGLACSQAEVFGSRLGAQPPTIPSADAYEIKVLCEQTRELTYDFLDYVYCYLV